jgi:hypothetical protein
MSDWRLNLTIFSLSRNKFYSILHAYLGIFLFHVDKNICKNFEGMNFFFLYKFYEKDITNIYIFFFVTGVYDKR